MPSGAATRTRTPPRSRAKTFAENPGGSERRERSDSSNATRSGEKVLTDGRSPTCAGTEQPAARRAVASAITISGTGQDAMPPRGRREEKRFPGRAAGRVTEKETATALQGQAKNRTTSAKSILPVSLSLAPPPVECVAETAGIDPVTAPGTASATVLGCDPDCDFRIRGSPSQSDSRRRFGSGEAGMPSRHRGVTGIGSLILRDADTASRR